MSSGAICKRGSADPDPPKSLPQIDRAPTHSCLFSIRYDSAMIHEGEWEVFFFF